jgi:hypothetical protein
MADVEQAETDFYTKHWRLWVAIFWVAAGFFLLYGRWTLINWFALGDTDDNLRMMQVRALLAGQDWFDLRQYRLDPPNGANVHWSRIVDLPIAGIMLLLRPLLGGPLAEKVAVSLAPMLPMAVAMGSMALICRRLLSPKAFALGVALLLCAHSARGMWTPLRIDHHGWQLAMLSLAMVGLVDPKRARGGLLLGGATALSFSIGLEMLLYLAAMGAAAALMWVRDPRDAPRLITYGASLGGGCAVGYLLFASYDNRMPVCDALSPVWLSVMMAAGVVAVALPILPLKSWITRLGAGAVCAVLIGAGFALAWPDCLGRLEGVSPELQRLWLDNVREARPIYRHDTNVIVAVVSLPIMGLIGYAVMLWRTRHDAQALVPWAGLGAVALIAAATLLWQSRAGPSAQLLAVPGASAIGWLLIPAIQKSGNMVLRVLGTVGTFLIISGLGPQYALQLMPEKPNTRLQAVGRANGRCPTLAALRPIALQPKGYVLTFLDLNPRLIAVTHHDGVAGPYHRNEAAILDLVRVWRGSAENAREMVARRGIDYVLICPGLSESTMYSSGAPKGFYVQLAKGDVPAWLQPIPLPKDSPYRMWRVVGQRSERP